MKKNELQFNPNNNELIIETPQQNIHIINNHLIIFLLNFYKKEELNKIIKKVYYDNFCRIYQSIFKYYNFEIFKNYQSIKLLTDIDVINNDVIFNSKISHILNNKEYFNELLMFVQTFQFSIEKYLEKSPNKKESSFFQNINKEKINKEIIDNIFKQEEKKLLKEYQKSFQKYEEIKFIFSQPHYQKLKKYKKERDLKNIQNHLKIYFQAISGN